MSDTKADQVPVLLVTATEKSTERTEAPASRPIRDAIYLVENLGLMAGFEYLDRMPSSARWNAVREVVAGLDARQGRKAHLVRLRRSLVETEA